MLQQSGEKTALLLQTQSEIEHLRKHVVLKEKQYKLFGHFNTIWINKINITNKVAELLQSLFHEYYEYGMDHKLFTMFNDADNIEIACLCSNLFTYTYSITRGDIMQYNDVELYIKACRPVMKYITRQNKK